MAHSELSILTKIVERRPVMKRVKIRGKASKSRHFHMFFEAFSRVFRECSQNVFRSQIVREIADLTDG